MINGRIDLHIHNRGAVTGAMYVDKILYPYERLFRRAVGLQVLLVDDYPRPHPARLVDEYLEHEDVDHMVLSRVPSYSDMPFNKIDL